MSWTDWQNIESSPGHWGAAVYEVRLTNCDGNPVQIPRFFAIDERGILNIGETSNMNRRHRDFRTALRTGYKHSEINLWHRLCKYCRLDDRFPKCALQYRFRKETDRPTARRAEERMLKDYIMKFGELPVLNSAIPDRYGDWLVSTQPSTAASA
jgi:hypothetical protein